MLKYATLIVLLYIPFLLSAQDCEIPDFIQKSDFEVNFVQTNGQVGVPYEFQSQIKFAKGSTEVLSASFIECAGFMPRGATIKEIKITEINGLPAGIEWYCSNTDCAFEGGSVGCIFFEGTPENSGHYPLNVKAEGIGSLWGISKTYYCELNDYYIVIEE